MKMIHSKKNEWQVPSCGVQAEEEMKDEYISIYIHEKKPVDLRELILNQIRYQQDYVYVDEGFVMNTCGRKCDYCYCHDGTGGYRIGKGCPIYVEAMMHSMENGKEKIDEI